MLIGTLRKVLGKRGAEPVDKVATDDPQRTTGRKPRREWEKVLLASLEENNLAPSEDVILHAFDLYQEDLYGPVTDRRFVVADLYAQIVADVASLQAMVPDLIERAMARHPFEFSQIIEHQEERR